MKPAGSPQSVVIALCITGLDDFKHYGLWAEYKKQPDIHPNDIILRLQVG